LLVEKRIVIRAEMTSHSLFIPNTLSLSTTEVLSVAATPNMGGGFVVLCSRDARNGGELCRAASHSDYLSPGVEGMGR
jgi:hypothetical protein